MSKILELREKRAKAWEAAKAFLDSKRGGDGLVNAEDNATYEKMEADVVALGKEVERLERQAVLDLEMATATSTPITGRPAVPGGEEKTGRAANGYKSAFWQNVRDKSVPFDVTNSLKIDTDGDGGYLVPDEYERTLVAALEEENIFRTMAKVITTSSGDRKIPVAATKGTASWIDEEGAIPESDDKFGQVSIGAYKLGTMIKVSEELLTDSVFNLESYIAVEFARRIGAKEEEATNGKYPQIALFENVVGLLSCRAGGRSDYQAVLEAFTEAEIPMPKSGRWATAGMVRGHGIDLAWVVKDAQYHRTAQRRRRLFAIVDYRGQRAGEILFVSQSLQGYFAARERAREKTAAALESGAGGTGGESIVYGICSDSSNSMLSGNPHSGIYKAETSRTLDQNCANPGCNQGGMVVVEPQITQALTMRLREGCAGGGKGPLIQNERSGTLATGNDQYLFCADKRKVHPDVSGTLCASGAGLSRPAGNANETDLCVTYCLQGNMIGRQDKNGPQGCGVNIEKCFTVSAADHHAIATFIRQRSDSFKQGDLASTQTARQYKDATDLVCSHSAAVDCRNFREICEISGTLQSKCTGGYSLNYQNPVRTGYIVRRLTPTEAERLMSFEDGWTQYGHDGKLMSDCLPCPPVSRQWKTTGMGFQM